MKRSVKRFGLLITWLGLATPIVAWIMSLVAPEIMPPTYLDHVYNCGVGFLVVGVVLTVIGLASERRNEAGEDKPLPNDPGPPSRSSRNYVRWRNYGR